MRKIPTLFERKYENHKVVGITDKLTLPGLQVVLDGKARPTVKVDGSCCAVIDNEWYKRYDCKKGKKAPEGAIPCQDNPDPITGHWPHWVKLDENKPEDKWFIEAFKNYAQNKELKSGDKYSPVTYEAVGPHFQGNPYGLDADTLYLHGSETIEELQNKPLTIDILREYLKSHAIEGIVFWFEDPTGDEPICKIKRSDFGLLWPWTLKVKIV